MNTAWVEKIKKILTIEEGCKEHAYDDATGLEVIAPKGALTIGIGHNLQHCGLSRDIIDRIFFDDISEALAGSYLTFGEELFDSFEEARQIAITCLVFQLGYKGFLLFYATIAHMKAKRWEAAANQLKHTLWAKQVSDKRRDRTLKMIRSCEYDSVYKIPNPS